MRDYIKYIIFIGLVWVLQNPILLAQAPGYQGKKAFVEYNFNYMVPLFNDVNSVGKSLNDGFALNVRHNYTFGYTLSRSLVFNATFDKFKTGANLPLTDGEDNLQEVFSQLNVTAFGLKLDRFFTKKGALAPYGFYGSFESKYVFAKPFKDELSMYKTSTVVNSLGLGMKKIFFKKIVLNIAGAVSWTWGKKFKKKVRPEAEAVREAITARVFNHYLFENTIGIGILLF